LKKSRRTSEETDSEEDGSGRTKEKRNREKHEKKAATGLGDMSSDSNGEHHSNKEESEEEQRPEGFKSQNDLAKAAVLATSSEDENGAADPSSDEQEKTPDKKEKLKKEKKPKKVHSDTESEPSKPKRKNKPALLSMKLSETETSEDEAKYRSKMEKKAAVAKEAAMDSDNSPDSSDVAQSSAQKKKPTKKRKILSSDENGVDSESASDSAEEESEYEESDSSVDKKKKRNRRRKSSSSDDSDSDKPKKKRKRIKAGTDSDEDKDDLTSPNKGRHEIRRILKEKHLTEETKEAAVEERERRKRIEERQALYNKTFALPEGKREGENVSGQLVLDFHPETMEVLVEVNKKLVKKLKPHQVKGVKFMWDACFESIAQIKSGKNPGGAILAHCMGLGKTLQTITLTQTLLDTRKVPVNRVMVICPVNTVKNWQDEYEKWLTGDLEVDVFEMSAEKDNWGRADRLNQWFREGGVLIIGYEMFRNLVNEKNNKFKKKQRETFNNCLLDPGPDLVICDEGHLLKNEKSAITKAVNRIKTLRRIVLTGTPLQNNLKEYFEMVNFVKPHLLGSRKEFMNRFVNPIVNGQHSDSTERDVRTMKKRSFILSDLLKGCMQRLDYNVLVPYLQPKQEYVISIALTDLQKRLYKYYLENYAKAGQIGPDGKLEGGKKGGLFYDVQNLSRIWNHPCILLLAKQRKEDKEEVLDDDESSLKDFICDEDEDDSGNDDSDIQELDSEGLALAKKVSTRSDKPDDLVEGLVEDVPIGGHKGWWNSFLGDGDKLDELKFGNKMVLLMDILKESALIGDKVLVFSQSLLSLDLIEDFLSRVNDAHEDTDRTGDSAMADYLDTWIPGKDYYRMDGSTSAETRKIWCKFFNRTTSHRMRLFLISTKAGGLGINLVAANRVIIFDASWNPSHDVQSIFRVFRFGQTKPVYIYRFLAKGTMEEKIYDRQVTKQSLSARVVDEQQIERHFTMNELSELYEFNDEPISARPIPAVPEDRLLAELVDKHKDLVWGIQYHDSLLEHQVDENLTAEDRKTAWDEYEQERKGMIQTNVGIENTQQFGQMLQTMLPKSGDGRIMASPINPMAIQAQLRQMNPELSHEELVARTRAAIMQLQNMHRTQTPVIVNQNTLNVGQRNTTGYDQSFYQAEMAKAKAMINQQYPGMYRFG